MTAQADLTRPVVILWDIILIVGFVACVAVILTAWCSRRIYRSRPWYLLMGASAAFSLQYILLLGYQLTSDPIPHTLCLLQASVIYAAPQLLLYSLFALFLQLFLLLVEVVYDKPGLEKMLMPFFTLVPFFAWLVLFLMALAYGLGHPRLVTLDESSMFCHLDSGPTVFVSGGSVVFACLLIFVIEVYAFVLLWKHWHKVRTLKLGQSNNEASFSLAIRTSLFSLLPMLSTGVSISAIASTMSDSTPDPTDSFASHLILATPPLFAGIIFGSQRDILTTWMFWKRSTPVVYEMRGKDGASSV